MRKKKKNSKYIFKVMLAHLLYSISEGLYSPCDPLFQEARVYLETLSAPEI